MAVASFFLEHAIGVLSSRDILGPYRCVLCQNIDTEMCI